MTTTSTSSSFSTSSSLSSYQVKTKLGDVNTNEQYYDITDISADELHLIKEQDPFLYYSIPTPTKVHQDPPRDRKRGSCTSLSSSSSESSSSSTSTEDRPFMQQQPTRRVSRKSCISVECHPDLLMDDIFNFNNVDLDDMDMGIARDVDVEDPTLAMLLSLEDLDDRLTSSSYPNRIQ